MEDRFGENYFFDVLPDAGNKDKVFVLVIYDIVSQKRRTKLAKFLQGYGFRVQKSAFEAIITKKKYEELCVKITKYLNKDEDSVKIYKIIGKGSVVTYGLSTEVELQDVIVL